MSYSPATSEIKTVLPSNNSGSDQEQEYDYTRNEREELAKMARKLRRMKRQMLLKQVETPHSTVDSFRELLIRITSDQSESSGSFSLSSSSCVYDEQEDSFRRPRAGSFMKSH